MILQPWREVLDVDTSGFHPVQTQGLTDLREVRSASASSAVAFSPGATLSFDLTHPEAPVPAAAQSARTFDSYPVAVELPRRCEFAPALSALANHERIEIDGELAEGERYKASCVQKTDDGALSVVGEIDLGTQPALVQSTGRSMVRLRGSGAAYELGRASLEPSACAGPDPFDAIRIPKADGVAVTSVYDLPPFAVVGSGEAVTAESSGEGSVLRMWTLSGAQARLASEIESAKWIQSLLVSAKTLIAHDDGVSLFSMDGGLSLRVSRHTWPELKGSVFISKLLGVDDTQGVLYVAAQAENIAGVVALAMDDLRVVATYPTPDAPMSLARVGDHLVVGMPLAVSVIDPACP